MVTIDNIIKNVKKEFDGDLEAGRRNYERAKQGVDLMKEEMSALEERLKEYTGFDSLNLPDEPMTTEIRKGNITFEIRSIKRTKRPAYKEAVIEMERYLNGISFLLSEGRTITGIVK